MKIAPFVNDLLPKSSEERIMASATFINTFGNGLFSVTSAIYFTRIVGITPLQLGFAFSLAAGIGLFESITTNGRAHGPVDNQDSLAHGGFEFGADVWACRHGVKLAF